MENNKNIELVQKIKTNYDLLQKETSKIIVGQTETVNTILTALICNGHCLLIGVPGLAKTLMIKTISQTLDLNFNRIQFTPDLMPSDILGSEILQIENETGRRFFEFNKGPIFSNILLADEINRTPPKTQSALLESMQENSVTSGGKKFKLEKPFFVLATQNPIEQEGTYPLPEAQLDRFMFSIQVNYPTADEEKLIVKNTTYNESESLNNIISKNEIIEIQKIVRDVIISDELIEYIIKIIRNTRAQESSFDFIKKYVNWGAGPRASQYLTLAAKATALLNGRTYCTKDDILKHIYHILGHRIILNFNAAANNLSVNKIIDYLIENVKY